MDYYALTNDLNTVDTTAAYPLGERIWVPAKEWLRFCPATLIAGEKDFGDAELIYVFNDDVATVAQGEAVMQDTSDYSSGDVLRTTGVINPAWVYGSAQWALPVGSSGWVLSRGVGLIECDGSVAAGSGVTTAANGQFAITVANAVATTDTGAETLGLAHATDAGASTLVRANINCGY